MSAACMALAVVAIALLASALGRRARRARCRRARAGGNDVGTVACAAGGRFEPGLRELAEALAAGCAERVAVLAACTPGEILREAPRSTRDVLLLARPLPRPDGPVLDPALCQITRAAGCAVAILFPRSHPVPRSVLVPVHGSPDDELAVALAARIQVAHGCRITIATGGHRARRARARDLLAATGASGVLELAQGPSEGPAQLALTCARDHDLVIVSAGRKGDANPDQLGFFRERLVRACPVSVLLVMAGRGATMSALARIAGDVRGASSLSHPPRLRPRASGAPP